MEINKEKEPSGEGVLGRSKDDGCHLYGKLNLVNLKMSRNIKIAITTEIQVQSRKTKIKTYRNSRPKTIQRVINRVRPSMKIKIIMSEDARTKDRSLQREIKKKGY